VRKFGRGTAVLAALLVPLIPVVSTYSAAPAGADAGGMEQQFVDAINAQRAAHNAAPLHVDVRLVSLARWWSQQMADAGSISHNPRLSEMLPGGWTLGGENVGVGPRFDTLESAFENSQHHFENMIEPKFTSIGVGVVAKGDSFFVTEDFMDGGRAAVSHVAAVRSTPAPVAPAAPLPPAVVAVATNPIGTGYWTVSPSGATEKSQSPDFGSLAGAHLNAPIVAMAAAPSGAGYWMLGADSGVFAFGDAAYRGSTIDIRLNRPVVSVASTPTGNGYWIAAGDGGVFAFGDAQFFGSMGGRPLNKPIVGIASTPSGNGYWLVASDGGIFAFGDAPFAGSAGAFPLNQPIVQMAASFDGHGYWLVGADGGVFAFGVPFWGSPANSGGRRFVGMAVAAAGQGYWLLADSGDATAFGDTTTPNAQPRLVCRCAV
jgi:hypothetical protein